MRSLLITACLLIPSISHASLSPADTAHAASALPPSRLASCINATELWYDNVEVLRNNVAILFTTHLGPGTFFSTRTYQAESPYDLPHLLESARLYGPAEELRQILASLKTELTTSCTSG
ncbi:MAG: hypothetical protein EON60_04205 [Alphaproteobacteria bacterium]|nr:MAG: hypothetical protein EON60_04205 [Alphaproteobacteria bacterium]